MEDTENKETSSKTEDFEKTEKKAFKDKFLDFIDKSVDSSKRGIKKAGEKINDFGDRSVQKIELSQQKSKLEKLYNEFGKECFLAFDKQEPPLSAAPDNSENSKIQNLYARIKNLTNDIAAREKKLSDKENQKS